MNESKQFKVMIFFHLKLTEQLHKCTILLIEVGFKRLQKKMYKTNPKDGIGEPLPNSIYSNCGTHYKSISILAGGT